MFPFYRVALELNEVIEIKPIEKCLACNKHYKSVLAIICLDWSPAPGVSLTEACSAGIRKWAMSPSKGYWASNSTNIT